MNRGSLITIGLLLVGILAFVCLTCHWPNVERDLLSRAQLALEDSGMRWASLDISGRDLTLRGNAPNNQTVEAARAVVLAVWGVRAVDTEVVLGPGTVDSSSAVDAKPTAAAGVSLGEPPDATAVPELPSEAADTVETNPAALSPDDATAPLTADSCQDELNATLTNRTIQFAKNSSDIVAESLPLLTVLNEIIARCPDVKIEISGHTDSGGPEDWNQELSTLRARAVRRHLRTLGVRGSRLRAVGRGSSQQVASDETAAGRAANRRIEFKVL